MAGDLEAITPIAQPLDVLTQTIRSMTVRAEWSIDNEEGRVTARRGVAQLLYANGGTIPNRGLFHMRNARTHEQIGELDEEFVWENGPGSRFAIGNRHWVVERVSHSEASIYRTRSALYWSNASSRLLKANCYSPFSWKTTRSIR